MMHRHFILSAFLKTANNEYVCAIHLTTFTNMTSRRKFIAKASIGSLAAMTGLHNLSCSASENQNSNSALTRPTVISTWNFGLQANSKAIQILKSGGSALDAVEEGVKVIEADGSNSSVGYGGLPDRDGRVTLDACIMDANGMCGSVLALEHIMHPISVARLVMEKTPHVMLVGEGALELALANGMKKENLLTEKSMAAWEEWKKRAEYKPVINVENHDTIGMVAMDANGDLSGACTTSGLAYKMRGRVGDSPIIGAGLFVDNEVGAAAATGLGEAVLRTLGTFLVVEFMRQGVLPEEACKMAINRIVEKHGNYKKFQVGLIAMNKEGMTGGYSIQQGFSYAKATKDEESLVECKSFVSAGY